MSPKVGWTQLKSLKYNSADAKHEDLPPKLLYQEHIDAMMETVSCSYSQATACISPALNCISPGETVMKHTLIPPVLT